MYLQSQYNVSFCNSSGYITMQFEDSKAHDLSKEEMIPMPQWISEWSVKQTLPFRFYEIELEDGTTRWRTLKHARSSA